MTDNTSTRTRPELKPLEVGVGAGAAVVTAFASSYLGTAGTLTGAALASVIGTVSTSLLRTSAEQTNESLHRTAVRLRQARAGPELAGSAARLPGTSAGGGPGADPAPDDEEAADEEPAADRAADQHQDAVNAVLAQPAVRNARRVRWPVLAAGALIAFVVALLAITGVESALGKPLAALVGEDHGSGTSVGRTLGEDSGKTTEAPSSPTPTPSTGSSATTTEPAGTQSGTPSPTAGPSPSASATPRVTPSPPGVPSPAPSAGGGSAPGGAPSP